MFSFCAFRQQGLNQQVVHYQAATESVQIIGPTANVPTAPLLGIPANIASSCLSMSHLGDYSKLIDDDDAFTPFAYLPLEVDDIIVSTLWDSGSTCTLTQKDVLGQIAPDAQVHSVTHKPHSATNNALPVIGGVSLKLTLEPF